MSPIGAFSLSEPRLWARVRYADPARAQAVLGTLLEAAAPFLKPDEALAELRLRPDSAGVQRLYIGLAQRWMRALQRAAGSFGLRLDPAQEPMPLVKAFAPGAWQDIETLASDARLTKRGMYLGIAGKDAAKGKDLARQPGAALHLPLAGLGLSVQPELPYAPQLPAHAVWRLGAGGVGAPAGLVGDDQSARYAFLAPLILTALAGARGVVVIDGTTEVIARLGAYPAVAAVNRRILDLSLVRAGQVGFNPLVDSPWGDEVTFLRWRWWLGGMGIGDVEVVRPAFEHGVRSLQDLRRFWRHRGASAYVALDMLEHLFAPEAPDVEMWLSGTKNLQNHLRAGGHIFVECPRPEGARLHALRALLGVVAETDAQVVSVGVRWEISSSAERLSGDERVLARLDPLYQGRRWATTLFTRCEAELAAKVGEWRGNSHLAEYLMTLPDGAALALDESRPSEEQIWLVQAPESGLPDEIREVPRPGSLALDLADAQAQEQGLLGGESGAEDPEAPGRRLSVPECFGASPAVALRLVQRRIEMLAGAPRSREDRLAPAAAAAAASTPAPEPELEPALGAQGVPAAAQGVPEAAQGMPEVAQGDLEPEDDGAPNLAGLVLAGPEPEAMTAEAVVPEDFAAASAPRAVCRTDQWFPETAPHAEVAEEQPAAPATHAARRVIDDDMADMQALAEAARRAAALVSGDGHGGSVGADADEGDGGTGA